ncbi:hypothetical protein HKK52_19550 [Pseudomonas sp. ADAK2]|uniref:hypothetical protein n=1 Tax=unclassified Pseudomonas TaxID=196821 RepID=UPI00146380ED|nr:MULTISPECIES: hypothetical protein [unclassified Pseudomonas]QJI43047.1 hypothetical protein HKK53_19555 [Pseudomonas sp. ADAK7]QJI49350.1 hypothetical protein HKK52_19550 [Pseudomonas sp. ADAK2]
MDPGNVSAIISAVAGISGVLLGNSFVLIKEWWVKRKSVNQATTYLGIIVVSHLDRFATECFDVCIDDGTWHGQPAGQDGHSQATTPPPIFRPLELDVDWRLLPKDLMYSILRIPDQQDQLHGKLRGIQDFNYDPPDHPEYFWTRRRGYAVLGLHVSDIVKKLRSYAGLPVGEPLPDEWDRDKNMSEVIAHLDELERKSRLREPTLG